jgi:Fe-S-cluster containining protein
MIDSCQECGLCCMNTEMFISENEIKLILQNLEGEVEPSDFCFLNADGFYQLKNVNGVCYFFNKHKCKCKIYEFRPKGCLFYPLVYDTYMSVCIIDKDCPHPQLIYPNKSLILNTCLSLKSYLKSELEIDF